MAAITSPPETTNGGPFSARIRTLFISWNCRATRWLGVSYSVWHNQRQDRAGHWFQGRFKAVVVEEDAGWREVARYVHLNPVRVAALGLEATRRSRRRSGT